MKKLNGLFHVLVCTLAVAIIISLTIPETTEQSNVHAATKTAKLSKKKASIYVDKKVTIKVSNIKSVVKVTTSKKTVATVKKSGKNIIVTGKKAGKSVISVKVRDLKKKTRKLKCTITVKPKPIYYGTVNGNVTYHYNQYRGYVADTNAKVFLIPTDGKAKKYNISWLDFYSPSDYKLRKMQVYFTRVDGMGNYTINNVPTGNYRVLMISDNCTVGDWYDAYDDSIADAKDSYYKYLVARHGLSSYLKSNVAFNLAKTIMWHNTYSTTIKVYKNSNTTSSYAFPYTYD